MRINPIITSTWRTWLRSPGKMACVLIYVIVPPPLELCYRLCTAPETLSQSHSFTSDPWAALPAVVFLGAGIISKERDKGILATIFARPIRRGNYIFSKWIALALAALASVTVGLFFQLLIYLMTAPSAADVLNFATAIVSMAITIAGSSAAMIALSTIAPLYGDVFLFILALLTTFMLQTMAGTELLHLNYVTTPLDARFHRDLSALYQKTGENLQLLVVPQINFQSMPITVVKTTVAYLANVLSLLLVSVWWMNRKEISYGSQ